MTNFLTQLEGQLHGEDTAVMADVENIVSWVSFLVGGVEVSRAGLVMPHVAIPHTNVTVFPFLPTPQYHQNRSFLNVLYILCLVNAKITWNRAWKIEIAWKN